VADLSLELGDAFQRHIEFLIVGNHRSLRPNLDKSALRAIPLDLPILDGGVFATKRRQTT
jgi:hypothetical protein